MSHPSAPKSLASLREFQFEKILNEDPLAHTIAVLGSFPSLGTSDEESSVPARVQAVVRIEKTALDTAGLESGSFFRSDNTGGALERVKLEGSTDIYTWFFGWLGESRPSDLKINVICPATQVHVLKYMKQELTMVTETPEIYVRIVRPYILAFPPKRTQWVENILTGVSEQSKVLFSCPDYLILPDMKWDLTTVSSLYLMALVQDRTIRSLRDLRRRHVGLLKHIRLEAARVVQERWGVGAGGLRMYVHYQPSYYHFHVHIVNVNNAIVGMAVGQAHLLDDIISLLELEPEDGPGIYERMTLTYGLGSLHGLYQQMVAAQE